MNSSELSLQQPATACRQPLVVLQVLPELESGGVERGTLEVARHLVQQGHRSLVVSGGGRLVQQLEEEGSKHIEMPLGKKSPLSLAWIPAFRHLLTEHRVNILHLRSRMPAWIAYLAWKSLPTNRRPRLVTTFHGFYSVNQYSAIMTKGEKVIAVSQTIADHIREHYRVEEERIVLIHRGVDIEKFAPEAVSSMRLAALRRQWGLTEKTFRPPAADLARPANDQQQVIRTVKRPRTPTPVTTGNEQSPAPIIMLPGRISRWKGHDVFLRSLAQIKNLPWLALCVGDMNENSGYGDQLMNLRNELGLEQRVKFVGHCADMPAALLLADLVVSPASTEAEAFGRIAVEGAAMGKPVIASAHGGSLETVLPGQTGWLVTPNDATALADALLEALSNIDKCRHLGETGRQWVHKKFTTATMCKQTLTLYEKLSSPESP